MRIEQLGTGTPEVAVVGGIHGDELCGIRAVERLMEASPPVERPVLLVLANERAIEAGERYLDADLNRSFPGDPGSDAHEERLAAELGDRLRGTTALGLHSTQSHPEPFLVVDRVDPLVERLARHLPVETVVDTGEFIQGRLFAATRTVEVECGLQGSDVADEEAIRVAIAYLEEMDVLAPDVADDLRDEFDVEPVATTEEVPVFRLTRSVPKTGTGEYTVSATNFERVPAGERFASTDGNPLIAEEDFYPVLLSAEGYDDIFGYAAEKVQLIDAGEAGTAETSGEAGNAE